MDIWVRIRVWVCVGGDQGVGMCGRIRVRVCVDDK